MTTTTTTTETETILALFNIKCTSIIQMEGSVFDGCGDDYEGSHLGYTYQSNWKGVSDRYSCIVSPSGDKVAMCDTVFGGRWFLREGAPAWLAPLGEAERLHEEALAEERAERREAEEAIRRDRRELNRILSQYHGTRLLKHLAKLGKAHLAYLVG